MSARLLEFLRQEVPVPTWWLIGSCLLIGYHAVLGIVLVVGWLS